MATFAPFLPDSTALAAVAMDSMALVLVPAAGATALAGAAVLAGAVVARGGWVSWPARC